MGADVKHENEAFKADFDKIFAKGTWTKEDLSMMKDLKKIIYYNLAICAMEESGEHPGEGYLPEMSYARGRNSMNGQYVSRDSGYSGRRYYNNSYDDMTSSGRKYYDSEKEKAIHMLHRMMENTDDPDRKNALKIAINEIEAK